MIIFKGKPFRNLQEQVAYLTELWKTNALANEMGIKVIGQVEDASEIPADDPDHPYEYGDAYLVGTEAPYQMYIWTRANGLHPTAYFANIGYFPAPGPQGEPGNGIENATAILAPFTVDNVGAGGVFLEGNVAVDYGVDESHSTPASVTFPLVAGTNITFTVNDDNQLVISASGGGDYVPKITGNPPYDKVYVHKTDGTEGYIFCPPANDNYAGGIVRRDSAAGVQVPYTPGSDNNALQFGYAKFYFSRLYRHKITVLVGKSDYSESGGFDCEVYNNSSTAITSIGDIVGKFLSQVQEGYYYIDNDPDGNYDYNCPFVNIFVNTRGLPSYHDYDVTFYLQDSNKFKTLPLWNQEGSPQIPTGYTASISDVVTKI